MICPAEVRANVHTEVQIREVRSFQGFSNKSRHEMLPAAIIIEVRDSSRERYHRN